MTRQTPLVRGRWLYLSSVQLDLILMPLHSTLVLSKATTYLSRVDLLPQHQVTYCFPNTSYLTVPPTPGYLLFPQTQVTVPPIPSYCSPNTKLLTVPPTPSFLLFPPDQVIFLQFPQQQLQFPHIKSLSKYRQPKIRLTN